MKPGINITEIADQRRRRAESFKKPVLNPKVLLVHVGPDNLSYPFRSHPLGIMYLAAHAQAEVPGVNIELMDLKVMLPGPGGLEKVVADKKPDIIGFSCMTVHADWMHKYAALARKGAPDAMIIAGGPHPTCFPGRVLNDENIDAVVLGEGERAFVNILKARINGEPVGAITAVGVPDSLDPSERDVVDSPDVLPFPAWDKIEIPLYKQFSSFTILGHRNYMSLFSSRACPYSCIYCHNIFGRKFRPRTAENFLEEISVLNAKFGFTDFDILDDVFNLKQDRLVAICEGIIKMNKGITIAFPNGLRSDLLDAEILKLMRRAGTTYISFAIETASLRLQKLINKNLNLEKAGAAITAASKLGILCNGYFMMGFPTETEDELKQTIDFAINSKLDLAHFLRVTPFEGTGLYDMLDQETKNFLQEHTEYLNYEDRHLNLSDIPDERFRELFRQALKSFYLNPLRLYGIFKHHPNKISMLRYVPTALKRIFVKG